AVGAQEAGDGLQRLLPFPPRFSCCPWQGLETNRGVGRRDMAWVYMWSLYAQLVPERRLQRTQDLLDVT
ncbi:MAG: hypothetical protein ACK56F_03210, partial [bacterium]